MAECQLSVLTALMLKAQLFCLDGFARTGRDCDSVHSIRPSLSPIAGRGTGHRMHIESVCFADYAAVVGFVLRSNMARIPLRGAMRVKQRESGIEIVIHRFLTSSADGAFFGLLPALLPCRSMSFTPTSTGATVCARLRHAGDSISPHGIRILPTIRLFPEHHGMRSERAHATRLYRITSRLIKL